MNIPPPPPEVGTEFQHLFAGESIPNPEVLETVGGARGASLSFDDNVNEDEEIRIDIPIVEAEQFIDQENERDQGNPRPSA